MRKRVMAVAAVGLVVLGVWLGDVFRGFGTGEADSSESSETALEDVQVSLDAGSEIPSRGAGAPQQETAATTPRPEHADDVLTVLVDGDSYQLQTGDDEAASFTPATLEEVVERAETYPGNPLGVRVRLRFRRNSQEGARADLIEALQAAEIEREQIIEATDFVE